jgi:hypothetical protein
MTAGPGRCPDGCLTPGSCASAGAGKKTNWTINAITAVNHLDLDMTISFRTGDESPAASSQESSVLRFS